MTWSKWSVEKNIYGSQIINMSYNLKKISGFVWPNLKSNPNHLLKITVTRRGSKRETPRKKKIFKDKEAKKENWEGEERERERERERDVMREAREVKKENEM